MTIKNVDNTAEEEDDEKFLLMEEQEPLAAVGNRRKTQEEEESKMPDESEVESEENSQPSSNIDEEMQIAVSRQNDNRNVLMEKGAACTVNDALIEMCGSLKSRERTMDDDEFDYYPEDSDYYPPGSDSHCNKFFAGVIVCAIALTIVGVMIGAFTNVSPSVVITTLSTPSTLSTIPSMPLATDVSPAVVMPTLSIPSTLSTMDVPMGTTPPLVQQQPCWMTNVSDSRMIHSTITNTTYLQFVRWIEMDMHLNQYSCESYPIQRYAMAALYYAMGIGNGGVHKNHTWIQHDEHECYWEPGIVCNLSNDVIKVNIISSELDDTIPSEIGLLSSSEYLNFLYNRLSDTLPTQTGSLTRLGTHRTDGWIRSLFLFSYGVHGFVYNMYIL